MKASSDFITINAEVDDRNLAQNGNDRYYWYSVRDMMTLLVNARKDYLTYNNYERLHISGEEYSSLRENDQKLLIVDPYHQSNFARYLSDDIDKIIDNEEYAQHFWEEMPDQIIIPLLSGGHWRAIRIQVNYLKKTVSILWDDPYGEGAFPQRLKDILLEAIIPNITRLIAKEIDDSEFKLSLDKIVQVDKILDQQGKGNNAWDCGPIIMSNIIDYIKHSTIRNTRFHEYSISDSSNAIHEQHLIEVRNTHLTQYSKISGDFLSEDRFLSIKEDESHVAEVFTRRLEHSAHPYQQQISRLSPSKVNILFALIESNRHSEEQAGEYSEQEVKQALEYINQHVTPISLTQQYEEEHFDVNAINDLLKQKESDFNKLSFAIGADHFAKITAQGRDFVDKSLLIKDIIETGDEVTIITRPRRWGKTTNVDMLAKFFAIQVDEIGNVIATSPYKELFQRLRIGQEYSALVDEHQGQYPVIFFTFKNIKSETYQEIESKIITEIKKLYDQHAYLYTSSKLNENKKVDFGKYLNGNIVKKDIGSSLEFLSSLLKAHHGRQVYIFIDEYDALLNATYDTEEYERTLKLMRSILGNALKGNENLNKSVVTGITKIAKAGLFSDLNNVMEYSILDDKYAEYFGFTEDEVQDLLKQAKMSDIRIKAAVTEYYNGYQVGSYTIYNPWSIVSFFNKNKINDYWVNTEGSVEGDRKLSTGLLMTTPMQGKVRDLINKCYAANKETIEITISPEVVLHQLKDNVAAIWTVLAYGGYLSLSNLKKIKGSHFLCQARIPNKEVLDIYEDSISLWFKDRLDIDLVSLNDIALNIEDIGKFEELVRQLLLQRSEIIGETNESLFHSFIDGLFLLKGVSHRLSPEKKAGSGRIDSIYYPIKGKSNKIIIHEYKIFGNTDTAQIDKKIQEALWQVYEHYYFKEIVSKYKEFNYPHYQQVEIRGIVAFIDENTHNLGMRSVSICHDISEIMHILPFFESLEENDLIKLKNHYRVDAFMQEFRKIGSLQTVLEQLEFSALGVFSQTVFDLGKAIGNSELAKRLWSEQGDSLWMMNQKELNKLKGVGPKRAREIEEFISSRKKAKAEDTSTDLLLYSNKHLTRYEKIFKTLVDQSSSAFVLPQQDLIDLDMQRKGVIQFYGPIALFLEHSHSLHLSNVLSLINYVV